MSNGYYNHIIEIQVCTNEPDGLKVRDGILDYIGDTNYYGFDVVTSKLVETQDISEVDINGDPYPVDW